MKFNSTILAWALLLLAFNACDDGRIEESSAIIPSEEGRVVKLTGHLSGLSTWGDNYSVVVAGYDDKSDYAVITKAIPVNHIDGNEVEFVMNGVSDEVETLKLCAINRLRRSIVDFIVLDKDALSMIEGDTIHLDVGTLNVGMFSSIQQQIFNSKCVSCHGQSTFAGADLYLTSEKSYDALFNQPSKSKEGEVLVLPGKADDSFFYKVITTNGVVDHDHVDLFSEKEEDKLNLIYQWINNGAKR